jgi:UDP-N-acetylmuramyl-tripeptide synthetase
MNIPTILPVACHTDNVGQGTVFVAIKGKKEDGSVHILKALELGARAVYVDSACMLDDATHNELIRRDIPYIVVDDARLVLAQLSALAHGNPADKLRIVAVTGTKGKTTTVFLLDHILRTAGYTTALLSTVRNSIGDTIFKTNLTTRQPDYLHAFFAQCVAAGVQIVVMEVAAQALSLHRVAGLQFDGAIVTNFEAEHAEFYATIEEYFAAKCKLIDHLKPGAPLLVNGDDARTRTLVTAVPQALTFGTGKDNTLRAERLSAPQDPLTISLSRDGQSCQYSCPILMGDFNVYNMCAAAGLARCLGVSCETIEQACTTFKPVPGRLEMYTLSNGARGCIDYAHTPASYTSILSTLRALTDHLIVVFGAGGERDKTKRPIMGKVASDFADLTIVTSDNPRSEKAEDIACDIKIGIPDGRNVLLELDREKAIQLAYAHAKPTSIIVMLGKGPDEYQQIGSIKYPFSEKAILQRL